MQLRSLGVFSVAKLMGAMYALIGLLFLPFFLIMAAAGMLGGVASGGGDKGAAGLAAGAGILVFALVGAILMPIIYGAIGFVGGAIGALIYNFMAGRVGGIVMHLEPTVPQAVRAASA